MTFPLIGTIDLFSAERQSRRSLSSLRFRGLSITRCSHDCGSRDTFVQFARTLRSAQKAVRVIIYTSTHRVESEDGISVVCGFQRVIRGHIKIPPGFEAGDNGGVDASSIEKQLNPEKRNARRTFSADDPPVDGYGTIFYALRPITI